MPGLTRQSIFFETTSCEDGRMPGSSPGMTSVFACIPPPIKQPILRRHIFAFPRRDAPEFCRNLCPSKNRGRRESRVLGAPAAPCATKKHRGRSHRFAGTPGFPRAMVLTVSFVLSLVTGPGCHHHLADTSARLDASVGASGPHDFAVRFRRFRQRRHPRPPHPAPRS